jgi:hypothetical protein
MEEGTMTNFLKIDNNNSGNNSHRSENSRVYSVVTIAAIAVLMFSATTVISASNLVGRQQLAFAANFTTTTTSGGIFVTGHDPDYHASVGGNKVGAQHIIQSAIAYVTNTNTTVNNNNNVSKSLRILLVTDLRNSTGLGYNDPRLGMEAAGFSKFDVADYGSNTPGVLNLHTVNFTSYNVVVVASSFGGWLRQDELAILNNRTADLISYVNKGGGLVAFAEPGYRFTGWNMSSFYPGSGNNNTYATFGFVPFVVSETPLGQPEQGFRVTEIGASRLGLNDTDVNGNFAHNIFTKTGGMDIVDVDSAGNPVSLAVRDTPVSSHGIDRNNNNSSTPLTITAPRNMVVECNTYGGAKGVNLGIANVTDNSSNSNLSPIGINNIRNNNSNVINNTIANNNTNTIIITNNGNTTRIFPLGNTTVTWKAIDKEGHFATANQTVTVIDTISPNVTVSIIAKENNKNSDDKNNHIHGHKNNDNNSGPGKLYEIYANANDTCDPHPIIKAITYVIKDPNQKSFTYDIKFTVTDASGNIKNKELFLDQHGVRHQNENGNSSNQNITNYKNKNNNDDNDSNNDH